MERRLDMARRRMMDRAMQMRDGRNPYGSRGGYVVSDRARGRDGRMDYGSRGNQYDARYSDYANQRQDNARDSRDYQSGRQYDGTNYNFDVEGEYTRDGNYDYGYDMNYDYARGGRNDYGYDYAGGMLSDKELMKWSKKLMHEVEEKDKPFFSEENIRRRAEEMGIRFDKFSFEEFYTTVLMMYTDYAKTLGTGNMDIFLRLAKDWLCDEDASVMYGEKLAVYHDSIVTGA